MPAWALRQGTVVALKPTRHGPVCSLAATALEPVPEAGFDDLPAFPIAGLGGLKVRSFARFLPDGAGREAGVAGGFGDGHLVKEVAFKARPF